jgi:hypothetical protein
MATTLDPNRKTNQTLSGGNLVATSTGAGGALASRTVTGKHYFEAVITTLTGTPSVGLCTSQYATTAVQGAATSSLAYKPSGIVVINGATVATISAYVQGDRIGVAVDPTLQQVWFRVNNGNWNNNALNDPATGVGGIDYTSMALSTLIAAIYASLTGSVWTMKFSTPFTDTAPAGFGSLDTLQVSAAQAPFLNEFVPPNQSVTFGPEARAASHPSDSITKMFAPAGPLTFVSGIVEENGTPVAGRLVEVLDRNSSELLGRTFSAGDGSWSVCALGRARVRVVGSDPTAFNSLVFDNVPPV